MGTDGWSRAMPPRTAIKSLWQAVVICCAALNSAASRLSITIFRPLMPPEALHHAANAWACWGNSASSPGSTVLAASLNTAMLMVLALTPRTEEAPPGPGSQILPTPGQTPLGVTLDASARLPDVAAAAVVDVSATDVPATIKAAMASGSADLRSSANPLQIIPIPSQRAVRERVIQSAPRQNRGSGCRREPREGARNRTLASWRYPPKTAIEYFI